MGYYKIVIRFLFLISILFLFGCQIETINIENRDKLILSDYKSPICALFPINFDNQDIIIFEQMKSMMDILSISADGKELNKRIDSYDAEIFLIETREIHSHEIMKLNLHYYSIGNYWTIDLQPGGRLVGNISYIIPGNTKLLRITYRLKYPNSTYSKITKCQIVIRP